MKKHVIVKQTHLYEKQSNIMFKGVCNIIQKHDELSFHYFEKNKTTKVTVEAFSDKLHILREGDITTTLCFRDKEKTIGTVLSEFGLVEIEIFTHKYIKKENIIAIEYDVLAGEEVSDGFRILWKMKEDIA